MPKPSKFIIKNPSQRTFAENEALVRQSWANRRAAKQDSALGKLPPQAADGRRLMQLPTKAQP